MDTIHDILTLLATLKTLPPDAVLMENGPVGDAPFYTRAECMAADLNGGKLPSEWIQYPVTVYASVAEIEDPDATCNGYGCSLHKVEIAPKANIPGRR